MRTTPQGGNCLRFANPASAIRESRSRTGVSSDIGKLFDIGNGNQPRIMSSSFYVQNLSNIHGNRSQIGSRSASEEVFEHGTTEKSYLRGDKLFGNRF